MKKGFTLIELLVTIGLICVIGTVVVANMANNLSLEQDRQYENFKKTLENAACTFVELDINKDYKRNICKQNGKCSFTLDQLLKEGLIEEKDMFSPKTQDYLSPLKVVEITYPGGVKTCRFVE